MFHASWIGLVCLLVICLVLSGCRRQRAFEPTYPVSGSVTLDAQPLPDGTITFITPQTGDLQSLAIKDGKFWGSARGGNRRVEIHAYATQKTPATGGGLDQPLPVNYLPARYHSATTLTAKVTPDGPNRFDFRLASD